MKLARRIFLVLAVVALAMVGIVAAFYGIEDWRGAHAWSVIQHEVRARGGTTDFADVIPPRVPDDQNLAMASIFANALDYHADPRTKQLTFGTGTRDHRMDDMPRGKISFGRHYPTSSGGWERGHPLDLAAWQAYYRADPTSPHTPEPQDAAADVQLALSRYAAPLDDLARAVAERPRSRFPINWTQPSPYAISLRHGLVIQNFASTLRLRAVAELVGGDPATAAADLALVFRLSDALAADPIIIDHLVNITIIGLAAQPIWEGLAARRWDAGELARLQTALLREDMLADYARAMRCEIATTGRGLDFLEKNRDLRTVTQLVTMAAPDEPAAANRPLAFALAVAPRGWYDQNKARTVQFYETYPLGAVDPASHRVFPEKLAAGVAARNAVPLGPYTFFFRLAAPVFDDLLPRSARIQTICDQAATACALERFYLDHQVYPENLAALVPAYLDRVLTDVVDGAPMRYRRTGDGRYLLYDIGWNRRDDNGQVAWKDGPRLNDKEGDWVWQYEPLQPPDKIRRNR